MSQGLRLQGNAVKLSVVVPVYREEDNIRPFLGALSPVLQRLTTDYEIIFALDPSPDRTEENILQARAADPHVKALIFSRRFGQPMATLAGMQFSKGNAVIVMDVDLQDPPDVLIPMVAKWKEGFEVVYGRRASRKDDPLIYRMVCWIAYRIIRWLSKPLDIPLDTGDFRLMSRRMVDQILELKESHGFLRGIVAAVGFRQTSVEFDRPPRRFGERKYSRLVGSTIIGINGIVCFSNVPLALASFAGLFLIFCSAAFTAALTISLVAGRASHAMFFGILVGSFLIGGVQLLSVGILGEYIGRIYDEVKQRPHFIVDRAVGFE
jgi:polyisoprenyl-phosphate glycosyltransferase